jgi:AraC-like DNA-binding protein
LLLLYCVKGKGWCAVGSRLRSVRAGDALILSPGTGYSLGVNRASPWSVQWVEAAGQLVPDYLEALGVSTQTPLIQNCDGLELARRLTEILSSFQRGSAFAERLRASHALAYLLALLVQRLSEIPREKGDVVNRIAEAIIYMSDHVESPLRMSGLARMAGLSQAYFGELFKAQTGSSPRDYLHLLRLHRACQLLQSSELSIKEIAVQVGYQDPFHFSRQFKAFQGVSPTEYRLRR